MKNKYRVLFEDLDMRGFPIRWRNRLVRALQGQDFDVFDEDNVSFIPFSHSEPIELSFIANKVGIRAAAAALQYASLEEEARRFALVCAQKHITRMNDVRCVRAVKTAIEYCEGSAGSEELMAARLEAAAAYSEAQDKDIRESTQSIYALPACQLVSADPYYTAMLYADTEPQSLALFHSMCNGKRIDLSKVSKLCDDTLHALMKPKVAAQPVYSVTESALRAAGADERLIGMIERAMLTRMTPEEADNPIPILFIAEHIGLHEAA